MYKIVDLQGSGMRRGFVFATLEGVRDSLRSFHRADIEGVESMSLETLCEIGSWSVTDKEGNEVLVKGY